MSVYKYPQSKVIDEITFKATAQGAVRAYIHARPDVQPEQVKEIISTFQSNGWQAVPFNLDGQPTLEVRGVKTESKFLSLLKQNQWVSGEPTHDGAKEGHPGFLDKLKERTLQASGVAMAVADIGFIIYGLKEAGIHKKIDPNHKKRDFREAFAGLSYLTGSTVLTLYGHNNQSDLQVRDVAGAILNQAKQKGLEIPDDSAVKLVGEHRTQGIVTKMHNFFRKHPAEIGNMSYFTAGLMIAWSALQNRALIKPREGMTDKQISEMRKGGWGDTALGTSTMVAGLIGTFGKEKAPDPNAPKKEGLSKWWDKFTHNPLAAAGIIYMGSTLCHAYTTYVERKEAIRAIGDHSLPLKERQLAEMKTKAVPWRVLFIGSTILGEILLTISSKGHGEGVQIDDTVDQSVYALSADLIARQPPEMRDGLVDYMTGYLADPKVLGGDRQKIAEKLHANVECMLKNPWSVATPSTNNAAATQPAVGFARKETSPASWQAKVVQGKEAAASQQPQLSS